MQRETIAAKFCWLLAMLFLVTGCREKAYYGYVYDYETKKPVSSVTVNDYLNGTKAITNAKGYFYLEHKGQLSGRLILKKTGYAIDTLETISRQSGEHFIERFKGDTIYMFNVNSNFRDSINELNEPK
jgi:hypothetical protein